MLPAFNLRYGTFNHVYKQHWSDVLKFRSRNLFTTCEVCFALKASLSDRALGLEAKLAYLKEYRAHLHSQYCDRTVVWKLQSESAEPNSEVLLVSTDGLDQSKFSLPREPELKNNAGLSFGFISTWVFRSIHWQSKNGNLDIMLPKWYITYFVSLSKPQGEVSEAPCESTRGMGLWVHHECVHHRRGWTS